MSSSHCHLRARTMHHVSRCSPSKIVHVTFSSSMQLRFVSLSFALLSRCTHIDHTFCSNSIQPKSCTLALLPHAPLYRPRLAGVSEITMWVIGPRKLYWSYIHESISNDSRFDGFNNRSEAEEGVVADRHCGRSFIILVKLFNVQSQQAPSVPSIELI